MDEHRKMEINSDTRRSSAAAKAGAHSPNYNQNAAGTSQGKKLQEEDDVQVNRDRSQRRNEISQRECGGRREEGGLAHNYLRRQCT